MKRFHAGFAGLGLLLFACSSAHDAGQAMNTVDGEEDAGTDGGRRER
jgi:hypothetical protein